MQFTVSVALFAALASASHHIPQHFHHRRQYNTTVPQTTLTVFATSVHTITSCAASITDCPARASESTSEQVVTDTIEVFTVWIYSIRCGTVANSWFRPSAQLPRPSQPAPRFSLPTRRLLLLLALLLVLRQPPRPQLLSEPVSTQEALHPVP